MKIPNRLDMKIREDNAVQGWVHTAIADFEPWLRSSNFVFFPDYTDHGSDHVEQILITASSIIRDEAWAIMTPEDTGSLILAALLHDCAMHLTEDGFNQLIEGKSHTQRIEGFNDVPWSQLWDDFFFSAKRFDEQKLHELFGNTKPLRRPPSNPDDMTNRDKKLIGEFLRRYHPRLAHEIALLGVPGSPYEPLKLPETLGTDFADLAGLVARSHGLPLRATLEYLKKYDLREYGGVHAVFLMAVLRIADYLQIQAERAPSQMLRVKEIRSPISRKEWNVHQSIRGIRSIGDDPEAIFIQTKFGQPNNVETYLRLEEWLNGIQSELDICWAVFGEVYARTNLEPLGLAIRRVRSNLDDEKQFAQSVNYVPKRVGFDIARSEVLEELVGPLYGNRPEVGIRELIQNAVDAVRELWDFREHAPNFKNEEQKSQEPQEIKLLEHDADVVVLVDESHKNGDAKVIISDRGIGMTEKVITDYFLKAGASFCKSDTWAKQHEVQTEENETQLRSRVLRSGRFGVGALAAFLLGNKIKVYTRHITAEIGLEFEVKLGTEAIQLSYNKEIQRGTTIEIGITKERYQELIENPNFWDWYCLEKPKVLRLIKRGGEPEELDQRLLIPDSKDEKITSKWHLLKENEPKIFQEIYWSYFHRFPKSNSNFLNKRDIFLNKRDIDNSNLICNGISSEYSLEYSVLLYSFSISFVIPTLLIFDADGNLPFDLNRFTGYIDNRIKTNLFKEILKYFLAYLIANFSSIANTTLSTYIYTIVKNYSKHKFYDFHDNGYPFIFNSAGMSVTTPWIIHNLRAFSIAIFPINPMISRQRSNFFDSILPIFASYLDKQGSVIIDSSSVYNGFLPVNKFESLRFFISRYLEDDFNPDSMKYVLGIKQIGIRVFLMSKPFKRNVDKQLEQMLQENVECFSIKENNEIIVIDIGECLESKVNLDDLEKIITNLSKQEKLSLSIIAAELFLEENETEPEQTDLDYLWQEIIREPVIPFDIDERRLKLGHAYEVLADYIAEHEENNREQGDFEGEDVQDDE